MPYTWLQLQWLKNNSTLDATSKYEVFRSNAAGVTELSDKIMEVQHPNNSNEYIVVSDTPYTVSADDVIKTYTGPAPYDFMGPSKITTLTNTADDENNKSVVSWEAPTDNAAFWYYRTRAIDTDGHPSDLSREFGAVLSAGLHAVPYQLQRSTNGVLWEDLGEQAGLTYEELNVDRNGPNSVTNTTAVPSLPEPGVGKITLGWTNSDMDNGTWSYHYRVRTRDNAAALFPGHDDNWSEQTATDRADHFSDPVAPSFVTSGITDGLSGVEIRYRASKQTAPEQTITFDSVSKFIGFPKVVVGSVVVTPNAGGAPFTEGADYSVDYPSGVLTRLIAGSIPAGASVKANFSYNDAIPAVDSDDVLGSFDGTYFTGGLSGAETYEHTGLEDSDCFNYRVRVKDNAGNWSSAVNLFVNIDDSTPPPAPVGFSIVSYPDLPA